MTGRQTTTTFGCMGCSMGLTTADEQAARRARHVLALFDAFLSRFDPTSALSRLNRDPRATVPAPRPLRMAIRGALWAAQESDGLVDPTLLAALERQGYGASFARLDAAPLSDALACAPRRRPARPRAQAHWRAISVDDAARTVTRPPGLALDTGGSTKGLAADVVADVLPGAFIVDCGGDLRVRAPEPLRIAVEHPLTGEFAHVLHVAEGAIATSGIGRRVWRNEDGTVAHHLLDPATGLPAWTGLLQVTALAPTALAAETAAKAALLRGPSGARALLERRHGGVLVHDDGRVEVVAAIAAARAVAA